MRLLGFKNNVIGCLMLFIGISFIPLAFSADIIYPFLLTPDAGVEKYNYIGSLVSKIKPGLLLYLLWFVLNYFAKVNIDDVLNNWITRNIRDVSRIVLAVFIYQIKEVFDYMLFENVVPPCFNYFWFLIIWEVGFIFLLLTWAFLSAKNKG